MISKEDIQLRYYLGVLVGFGLTFCGLVTHKLLK